jgi:hypothetical protein
VERNPLHLAVGAREGGGAIEQEIQPPSHVWSKGGSGGKETEINLLHLALEAREGGWCQRNPPPSRVWSKGGGSSSSFRPSSMLLLLLLNIDQQRHVIPITPWVRVQCCSGTAIPNPHLYLCIPVTGNTRCYPYPCRALVTYEGKSRAAFPLVQDLSLQLDFQIFWS